MRRALLLCQQFDWYLVDLPTDRSPVALAAGFTLRAGPGADRWTYGELDPMNAKLVDRRIAAEGRLWLVVRDNWAAFACWIFPRSTPVGTARSGWVRLPEGVVCLEDSVTGPDFRGLRLALTP